MWRNPTRLILLTAVVLSLLVVSQSASVIAEEGNGAEQPANLSSILTPDYPYLAPDVLAFRDRTALYLSGRASLIAQGLDPATAGAQQVGKQWSGDGAAVGPFRAGRGPCAVS